MGRLPDSVSRGDYGDPVQRLLNIGETSTYDPAEWLDYAEEFGIRHEHVGELIRLACDAALLDADSGTREVWAPLHAWRALGQLRAAESVVPLLALMKTMPGDDVAEEELPVVLGMIGPAAIPEIAGFLADRSSSTTPVVAAITAVKEIAARHPECRAECVGILTRTLEPQAGTEPTISGFAVSALIDLAAVEAIDVIRAAFRRSSVDISIAGDEEDVEIALGLRERRATPAPRYQILPPGWPQRPDARIFQPDTETTPRLAKVGRNDLCPCGSGKKYKKCCLR
jgi:hypothetical protein